jgi:hypothetical protein
MSCLGGRNPDVSLSFEVETIICNVILAPLFPQYDMNVVLT